MHNFIHIGIRQRGNYCVLQPNLHFKSTCVNEKLTMKTSFRNKHASGKINNDKFIQIDNTYGKIKQ